MFIYFWQRERETEHERARGRERGRHRIQSRLQALSCQHRAPHGARTHRPRDHDLSRSRTLNRLSHPGAPGIRWFTVHRRKKCLVFKLTYGAPGWLSQLKGRLWLRSWCHGLWVQDLHWALCWQLSLEPAWDSVSPFLSAPPPLMHVLSLLQKSINIKKINTIQKQLRKSNLENSILFRRH